MASEEQGSVLTEISFKNFCRFEKVTIDLHSESISLLGENGRGKTTVLKGIELFANLFDSYMTDENVPSSINEKKFLSWLGVTELELIWYNTDISKSINICGKLSDKQIEFEVSKRKGTQQVRVRCADWSRSDLKQEKIEGPTVVSISNTGVFTAPFKADGQETEESDGNNEDIKISQNVYKICVDNRRHVRQLLGLTANDPKLEEALKAKGKQISSLLKRYGIREGCDVEFNYTKSSKTLQITVSEQGVGGNQDVSLPLSRCDAGLQQVIIIMLMVLYVQEKEKEGKRPRRRHLLLDEPVALFHGNLVRKLLKYLKQEGFCVVLACHAVDTLLACNRIISLDSDVCPKIILEENRSELGTLFRGSDHTTRLMEFSKILKTKCILIVENESDADVLKAWIKKVQKIDIEDKIVVHSNSGRPTPEVVGKLVGFLDRNLFHKKKSEQVVRESAKVFILTDRDYKAKMALEKEQRLLDENTKKYNGRIKVEWYCYKKNEQENYFLSAAALKSYLEEKGKSTENLETKLNDLVDKHCQAFTIREKYMNSVRYVTKEKGGKAKLKDPEFHQETEEEPRRWLKEQRSSFTDAKEVLKELGIEEDPQSYTRLIHHFPLLEIDKEIEDLVIKVLDFFKIPTGAAATPSVQDPDLD